MKENALFRVFFVVGSFKLLGIDLIYIIISPSLFPCQTLVHSLSTLVMGCSYNILKQKNIMTLKSFLERSKQKIIGS